MYTTTNIHPLISFGYIIVNAASDPKIAMTRMLIKMEINKNNANSHKHSQDRIT